MSHWLTIIKGSFRLTAFQSSTFLTDEGCIELADGGVKGGVNRLMYFIAGL